MNNRTKIPRQVEWLFFDSGRTLNYPITGEWFIPPNFLTIVGIEQWRKPSRRRRRNGLDSVRAAAPVDAHIETVSEEYALYVEAYAQLSATLPELRLSAGQIDALAHDLADNHEKYAFYPDVIETVPILSRRYRLGVISDAWPSLEGVFDAAGLRKHFEVFVLSSRAGEPAVRQNKHVSVMLLA